MLNRKIGNFLARESGLIEFLIVWIYVENKKSKIISDCDAKISAFATFKYRNKFRLINPMNLYGHNKLVESFYCLEGMKNVE